MILIYAAPLRSELTQYFVFFKYALGWGGYNYTLDRTTDSLCRYVKGNLFGFTWSTFRIHPHTYMYMYAYFIRKVLIENIKSGQRTGVASKHFKDMTSLGSMYSAEIKVNS